MSPDVQIASERVAFYVSHLPYFASRAELQLILEALRQAHALLDQFVRFERIYDDGASIPEDEVQAVAEAARKFLKDGPSSHQELLQETAQ